MLDYASDNIIFVPMFILDHDFIRIKYFFIFSENVVFRWIVIVLHNHESPLYKNKRNLLDEFFGKKLITIDTGQIHKYSLYKELNNLVFSFLHNLNIRRYCWNVKIDLFSLLFLLYLFIYV